MRLRILATAGDVAEEHAARDAGTWLAHATRVTHTAARADLRLAEALEAHPATAAAMRAGSVNQAQARVIVRSIDKLSDRVDELTRARAERHLIELAATFGPKDLEVLGARILDVAAPDIAEAELGKRLEREEQAARDKCSVKIKAMGDGISRITALVPDSVAERLTTCLDAQDSPRVVRSRSRGEAFCRLVELLDPTRLPDHGGRVIPSATFPPEVAPAMTLGCATEEDRPVFVEGTAAAACSRDRTAAARAKPVPTPPAPRHGPARNQWRPPVRKRNHGDRRTKPRLAICVSED